MKTLLKLVVAGLVANAVVHGALAASDYYRLKDDAQRILTFGTGRSRAELHAGILAAAADLGVPLAPEALTISRQGVRTTVRGAYTQPVEFFPTWSYPIDLSFVVDVDALSPGPEQ